MLNRLRQLWLRFSLAPFRTAIAAVIVTQAVIAIGGWGLVDPFSVLLPAWMAVGFNVAYLIAGLALLVGVLWPRGDVECCGLVVLGCAVTARGILFGTLLGWEVESISSLFFSGAVALACVARAHLILRGSR